MNKKIKKSQEHVEVTDLMDDFENEREVEEIKKEIEEIDRKLQKLKSENKRES